MRKIIIAYIKQYFHCLIGTMNGCCMTTVYGTTNKVRTKVLQLGCNRCEIIFYEHPDFEDIIAKGK